MPNSSINETPVKLKNKAIDNNLYSDYVGFDNLLSQNRVSDSRALIRPIIEGGGLS